MEIFRKEQKRLGEFIHKLKCKYNKIKIETVDERLTTVEAHKTMNFLNVDKHKKKGYSGYNFGCLYFGDIHK